MRWRGERAAGVRLRLWALVIVAGLLASTGPALAQDSWTETSTSGAPSARHWHTAIWTGSRMIVWGGYSSTVGWLNSGGILDPAANTWAPMATAAIRGRHVAVWTGSKMIVWGGGSSVAEIYDPAANRWTNATSAGAPVDRAWPQAVWTGSKMIVWGGMDNCMCGVSLNTGGVYDPAANSWKPTPLGGAPSGRSYHSQVWTGTKMIVWGGQPSSSSGSSYTNTGALYDPGTDTWTPMSTAGAPAPRYAHVTVWTGTKMIVWGGYITGLDDTQTGGAYDPSTNTWAPLPTSGAPSARGGAFAAVWTGSRMVVWGGWSTATGPLGTGGLFDPARSSWQAMTTANAPPARVGHTMVWTGSRVIVWGGSNQVSLRTGGIYDTGIVSAPPFGSFDTPAHGATGVTGAVPVTGWALDDVEVTRVEIHRNPMPGEPTGPNGKVYIGDATFVPGARPDVAAAYPTYPNADRAGWGYMLLTNMLPGQGNGSFTLFAYAHDPEGHVTLLGSKTITCSNATATRPFGTLDTPAQGQNVSGNAYAVFGWALTPQPGTIPTDGSTIRVYVDGSPLGNPTYNLYRSDIATLFPGYANSDGAVGLFVLDTTTLPNGLHTIAWSVTDDLGRTDGIGSRYFWVQN